MFPPNGPKRTTLHPTPPLPHRSLRPAFLGAVFGHGLGDGRILQALLLVLLPLPRWIGERGPTTGWIRIQRDHRSVKGEGRGRMRDTHEVIRS